MAEPYQSPTLGARRAQMFPVLADEEIARLRRFGALRRYADGECLFETGKTSPACSSCSRACCALRPRRARARSAHRGALRGRILRRNRAALGPARARGRRRGRRGRGAPHRPGAAARAAGRRSRSRRGDHARADPAPRRPDRDGRRRPVLIGAPSSRTWRGCAISLPATASRTSYSIRNDPDAHGSSSATRRSPKTCRSSPAPTVRCCAIPQRTSSRDASACWTPPMRSACTTLRRRRRPRGTRDRGLRGLGRPLGARRRRALLRWAGGRERAHRELSRLPDRHLGPGACGPSLYAGAEIRRAHADPGRSGAPGLRPPAGA